MNAVTDLLLPASLRPVPGVSAYDLATLPWRTTPRGHVREKAVRRDEANGRFLGLLAFEPLSRSGVHQHRGTATSYFLSGSLTDYQGTTGEGEVGINLSGATHDAVSYGGCTLVSRLEGPVSIPNDELAVHPHADATRVRNARPGTPPDISVHLARAVPVATDFAGVVRKPLFDYAGTGANHRLCALTLWPRGPALTLRHTALTDFFLLAGDLLIGDQRISGPAFVVIEPGTRTRLSSEFGCSLLAWAEGPAWCEAREGAELYGF